MIERPLISLATFPEGTTFKDARLVAAEQAMIVEGDAVYTFGDDLHEISLEEAGSVILTDIVRRLCVPEAYKEPVQNLIKIYPLIEERYLNKK